MKWVSKKQKDPILRDCRQITKFAWLPIQLDNGFTILFETYIVYQRYSKDYSGEFYWRDIERFQFDKDGEIK